MHRHTIEEGLRLFVHSRHFVTFFPSHQLHSCLPSAQPDAALHVPAPLPSPSAFAYGIKPTLAPLSHACDHLPQFAEHNLNADAAQMHEQLDGCLATLQALRDNPGTVRKDEAAWRKYWVPLTTAHGAPKCC
eukprot:653544-Pleurochrysis_carterae.AAC.4